MRAQHARNRRHSNRGLRLSGHTTLVRDVGKERVHIVYGEWRSAGIPVLVIDPAYQGWQLRGELGGDIDREAVAQRVQDRSQRAVRVGAILLAKLLGTPPSTRCGPFRRCAR